MMAIQMIMRATCHCEMRATCLSKGGVPTQYMCYYILYLDFTKHYSVIEREMGKVLLLTQVSFVTSNIFFIHGLF